MTRMIKARIGLRKAYVNKIVIKGSRLNFLVTNVFETHFRKRTKAFLIE